MKEKLENIYFGVKDFQESHPHHYSIMNGLKTIFLINLINHRYLPGKDGVKFEINNKDYLGRTLLHCAVWIGHDINLIKSLIIYGCDVNAQDKFGYTALHTVIMKWGNSKKGLEIINLLLSNLANPHFLNKEGNSSFQLAVKYGYKEIVDIIVNHNTEDFLNDTQYRMQLELKQWQYNFENFNQIKNLNNRSLDNKSNENSKEIKELIDFIPQEIMGQTKDYSYNVNLE